MGILVHRLTFFSVEKTPNREALITDDTGRNQGMTGLELEPSELDGSWLDGLLREELAPPKPAIRTSSEPNYD